ncbi:frataxin-like protein [Vibrio cholerae]|nr:frataxin-like protein [Vibrio cholerae]
MNETEFHQLVDSQLERIEAAIDEAGADIDYETSGNVMTLEFDDGSQIIHPEEGETYVVPYRNDSAVYSKPSQVVNA